MARRFTIVEMCERIDLALWRNDLALQRIRLDQADQEADDDLGVGLPQ